MNEKKAIYIIGAGMSGLTAAITLQQHGFEAVLLEQSDHVGGRLQTTMLNGMVLDHGFQVMLDAYPAVGEFLDLEALDLIRFVPGSIVFVDGKAHKIGDPRRSSGFLWSTLIAGVGSLKDKLLMFSLSRKLTAKSLPAIFETTEQTTLQYLLDYGFSDKIIKNFFLPFYTGIFLETDLQTSSRMFEFVFKMFSEGDATIPAKGIQEIPKQLAARLPANSIRLNTTVQRVVGHVITLEDSSQLHSDYTIIAGDASKLVPNLASSDLQWRSVTNLYFETDNTGQDMAIINLIASEDSLVNNFHFMHDVFPGHKNVLSASVVKQHDLNDAKLAERVTQQLREQANVVAGDLIKCVHIKKALPALESLHYSMPPTETQLTESIFLAGDQLSNGSLNAAMLNGKAAAQAVIGHIKDNVVAALPVV
jgi:protoporphyrinogen oxidase